MGFPWFKSISKKGPIDIGEDYLMPNRTQPLVDITLPKFRYFTDSRETTVPFKLTEASLEEWFNGLNPASESYLACQRLYRALKVLNSREISPALRFSLLDFIAIAIIPVIKRLEQPILERKVALSDEARRHHEMIVADYVALAQGFSLVAQDLMAGKVDKQAEQLLLRSLFCAIEALKKVLLYIGEAYEQPYQGFWSSCYRLYRCAEQYDLLNLNVKDGTIREDSTAIYSIEYSFKSLLVFYLSGLNQYKPKTMKTLLNIFMIWAPYVQIYKKIDTLGTKLFFAFSLENDAPPVFLARFRKNNNDTRYLSTMEIAKVIYDNLRNEKAALVDIHTMKRQELVQLVRNLSMGAHRKFMRVPEDKHCSGIIGFENILGYLRKAVGDDGKDRGADIADPKAVSQWKIPDLDLLPIVDYEKEELGSKNWSQKAADEKRVDEQPPLIWDSKGDGQQDKLDKLKIINSSVKGYGVVCPENHAKAEIGEFIGILAEDQEKPDRLEVGIIRRITQIEPCGVNLGVELFSSAAEAVLIHRPGNVLSKRWALLLRGIEAINLLDSIIYDTEGAALADDICVLQGDTTINAHFGNLLHSTGSLRLREIVMLPEAK